MFFKRRYRLNHCRKALQRAAAKYKKKNLSPALQEQFKTKILALQTALDAKDRTQADQLTRDIEAFIKIHHPTSTLMWGIEFIGALAFALVVAVIIRSMWFELYEIPTGSMRPTFKEQDHLTVSKTQFGINVPLETAHFYFDPDLVERTGAIIFSGDGLPYIDTNTTFLGIFPYKKRYIKRLAGKPEDSIYFYGGKLYVQDKDGKLVEDFLKSSWMEPIENIPFLSFEGHPQSLNRQTAIFYYFNLPLARVTMDSRGVLQGEIYDGKQWINDDLSALLKPHDSIKSLSDMFGFGNYAMGQLYTKDQLEKEGLKATGDGVLYLVLRHTPHMDFSKGSPKPNRFPKVLTTILPLQTDNLQTLMQNLYTARFVVENGVIKNYSYDGGSSIKGPVRLEGVPDGTYEFYYGKAYEVLFGGLTRELPKTHPIYTFNPATVQMWYNLGIRFDQAYQPGNGIWPTRFIYFRDGDLYAMGKPLLKKTDKTLQDFVEAEQKKQEAGSAQDPYIAFVDKGAPHDKKTFDTFALHIPPKNYLALGDNHAMSADSRVFGFVPEDNLQGVPDLILWPIGDRMGRPEQKPYPIFVTPRLIVWALAAIIGLACYRYYWYRLRRRVEL